MAETALVTNMKAIIPIRIWRSKASCNFEANSRAGSMILW